MRILGRSLLCCSLLAASLVLASAARAQRGGGGFPHGGGPPMGGGFPGGGFPGDGAGHTRGGFPPGNGPNSAGTASALHGGLRIGPPGRWWDDKHFAKNLKLRPEQQRQMDATFEDHRADLLRRFQGLQQEELRMEALAHARTLDEVALMGQIDRVAQARAELEKANTRYLLQLRTAMDPDQLERLEEHR